MTYAPQLEPIQKSAPYNVWLDVVLSDTSTQNRILWALEWDDSPIVLPTKDEIIEIGKSVGQVGNALNNWWLNARTTSPSDMWQISNIFEARDHISAMIGHLLSITSIDKSENPINNFSEEHEFKILEIQFESLKKALEEEWFDILYQARIYDVYNDFYDPEVRLDTFKAINRNRFKVGRSSSDSEIYQRLLTLKRKLKEGESAWHIAGIEARKAFELEYLITQWNFRYLAMSQNAIGLQPFREKIKNRWAYIKTFEKEGVTVKVDIDKYDEIPHLAEIEISKTDGTRFGENKGDEKFLRKLLKKLWLEKLEMVWWGSRKLFAHYKIDYFHFFE